MAKFLHLTTQPTPSPLHVMVGNGAFLPHSSFCINVNLTLDNQYFPIDLYPLDLSGIDMVLGVYWLSMVSPYIMDCNGTNMRFTWNGKMIELKGI